MQVGAAFAVMFILDTNVLIYASEGSNPHREWARAVIADAVSGAGAGVNAICLAELCVGEANPESAASRIRDWGVAILDVPAVAAEVCALAYREYRERRRLLSGQASPRTPLPDFFIGAHAQTMDWALATADTARITTYFPSVRLISP